MRIVSERGIALVSVLFFVLIVGMFSRVILANGPGMARLADQVLTENAAQRAAEAGAAYVRLQLREDGEWKGNKNGTTVNTANLKIVEDNGNVFGWMKGGTGEVSMFRIRFNYQDGSAAGGDDLPDPSNPIQTGDLSRNNVRSDVDVNVPEVNPVTFRVDDPASGTTRVPRGNALVRIEGSAGSALDLTNGPLDPPHSGADLTSRTLKVLFKAPVDEDIPDSALSAGGGIKSEVTDGMDVAVIGAGIAKLRSKTGVEVTTADGGTQRPLTMDGEVSHSAGKTINAVHSITNQPIEEIGDGDDFNNIKWEDVPKASTDANTAVQLPGGIYVVDAAGKYHYYDMDLEDYDALTPDGSSGLRPGGTELSDDFREVRSGGAFKSNLAVGGIENNTSWRQLKVTKDVNVYPSPGENRDFTITNLSGRPMVVGETAADSPYLFAGVDPKVTPMGNLLLDNAIISTEQQATTGTSSTGGSGTSSTGGSGTSSTGGSGTSSTGGSGTSSTGGSGTSGGGGTSTTGTTGGGTAPSNTGDIALVVNVVGNNGSVAAAGNAVISAPSVSIANTRQRLSVFAKEDITVSTYLSVEAGPYNPAYDGYGYLRMEGLIYSWGDTNIIAGTPGIEDPKSNGWGMPDYGYIDIKGAVVSYGGNPEKQGDTTLPANERGPGSWKNKNGDPRGLINFYGSNAKIRYDRTKLVTDPTEVLGAGVPVERMAYGFEN